MDLSKQRTAIPPVLVRLRAESGLTQEALAAALGVSVQAIQSWERGRSTPRADYLLGYILKCGKDPAQIVDGIAYPEDPAELATSREVEAQRAALVRFLTVQATAAFVRAAYHITFRLHRTTVMQLLLAYLRLPLHRAQRIARDIIGEYELHRQRGELITGPDPDMEALTGATEAAVAAVLAGRDAYTAEEGDEQ